MNHQDATGSRVADAVFDRYERFVFLALAVAALGTVSIVLSSWFLSDDQGQLEATVRDLGRDVGIALIVTAGLSLTVDFYFRRRTVTEATRLRDELNKDIYYAMLKQFVPESIVQQIRAHMIEAPILRRNFSVLISLAHKKNDRLRASVVLDYEISRLNEVVDHYWIDSELEQEGVHAEFLKVEVKSSTGTEVRTLGADVLTEGGSYVTCPSPPRLSLRVRIDLRPLAKGDHYRVKVFAEQDLPTQNFSSWLMADMTENLSVTYSAPEDIEIFGFANHPSNDLFSSTISGSARRYEIRGGILPYQGITVNWRRPPSTVDNRQDMVDTIKEESDMGKNTG